MSYTADELVAKYIELRDQKEKIENKAKLDLVPINQALNTLENVFGAIIAQSGKDSLKTKVGTAFKKMITSVSTTNLAQFINFAIDSGNQALLDIKPDPKAVREYLDRETLAQSKLLVNERTIVAIPGIKVEKILKIQVRKI